jgi:hypothetical protein
LLNTFNRRIGIALLAAILLFVGWYVEAEDFSQSRVSGKYVFQHDGIKQAVTLYPDHRFAQDDLMNGSSKHADGTWRMVSSGGMMCFSSNFLDAPEGTRGAEEKEVFATFKNYLGWVSITLNGKKSYKQLFSSRS